MSVWMVRAGSHGEDEELALQEGLAVIGFHEVDDLSQAPDREQMYELAREAYPDASQGQLANFVGQLHAFANRISVGDIVALPRKHTSSVALGRVTGDYQYREDLEGVCHVRPCDWIRPDVPRSSFGQDLLYSLGAFMTVCQISRNNAEERIEAILEGRVDRDVVSPTEADDESVEADTVPKDLEQLALDHIRAHIERNFDGHEFARLVADVLQAEGYVVRNSPMGRDGGVDILAGQGPLGFEQPQLCVQVKSGQERMSISVVRELQGTMRNFQADNGLFVSWGGYKEGVEKEAAQAFFSIRLWDDRDLLRAVFRNYDKLPEETRSALPLKRIWMLVPEEE